MPLEIISSGYFDGGSIIKLSSKHNLELIEKVNDMQGVASFDRFYIVGELTGPHGAVKVAGQLTELILDSGDVTSLFRPFASGESLHELKKFSQSRAEQLKNISALPDSINITVLPDGDNPWAKCHDNCVIDTQHKINTADANLAYYLEGINIFRIYGSIACSGLGGLRAVGCATAVNLTGELAETQFENQRNDSVADAILYCPVCEAECDEVFG